MLKIILVQRSFILLPICVLSAFNLLFAQEKAPERENAKEMTRFELEEVVVTATRIEEAIQNIPKNVTVITSDDIEQASSNNVVDLLARETSVNLRSLFGHDKGAGLDIRGMGDTSVSNVIVMVDGFRLNPPDLAGPDFSSIPLDQIERIEIVRGAGSVVYGDGAVGGVINIITKKGELEPQASLYVSSGSYDTFDGRGCFSGRVEKISFNINGDYYDTEGYRDNGFLLKKDVGGRFGYDLTGNVDLSLNASYHEDRYGLPGPVGIEDIGSEQRRTLTDRPEDSGDTTDKRVTGGIEADLGDWGLLRVHGGYRFRDNHFILGFTPLKSKEEQTSHIDEDTRTVDVSFIKEYELLALPHKFQFGMDSFETEYISERLDQDERKNSIAKSLGLFLMNQWSLRDDLTLHLGYRYNIYEGTFRNDEYRNFGGVFRWVNGEEFERKWNNNAFSLGLVYSLSEDTTFFTSYATSFRVPNVDELARADDDLSPQKGKHIEVGSRHAVKGLAELSVSLFRIEIEDEIFFDAGVQINRNFDEKTKRQGVEADVKVYPTDFLYLWGNYTYMSARFEESDTFVPLVPRYKASAGAEWHVFEPLLLAITGTWVGSRFDGNDENNVSFRKLDSYQVFDCKLTYIYGDVKIFAGVNNMFDQLYSTVAYSETYYPMPTRNFYGGLKWTF
jgi:iron complex outermembrane receptor protein